MVALHVAELRHRRCSLKLIEVPRFDHARRSEFSNDLNRHAIQSRCSVTTSPIQRVRFLAHALSRHVTLEHPSSTPSAHDEEVHRRRRPSIRDVFMQKCKGNLYCYRLRAQMRMPALHGHARANQQALSRYRRPSDLRSSASADQHRREHSVLPSRTSPRPRRASDRCRPWRRA